MEERSVPLGHGLGSSVKRATLIPLIAITYCMVAGGPYGLEDSINAAGYRNVILLLLGVPLVWAFPVTLMVSELSTALPEDGGYYVWVRRAMGPFWGFQEAWLSLAASIFDMALYPTMLITYLARLWPAAAGDHLSTWIGIALIAACVGMNLAGIRSVGGGALLMTVLVLLPFAVMVVAAFLPHAQPATAPSAPLRMPWMAGMLALMWNYMGWDNASTIAGEVDRPQRTYPLAMLSAVLLVALTYVIPVAAAARSGIAPSDWDTGSWVNAGRIIGGGVSPLLGRTIAIGITAGGMVCAFSMFNSLILSYSRVPVAMAVDGFLPKAFAWRTARSGVPWLAVIVCAIGWGMCMKLGFDKLVMLDTLLYGLSLILEFAALIALRITEPNLNRPYKIPGGLPGCILVSVGPMGIMCLLFCGALSDDSAKKGLIFAASTMVAGFLLYFAALWINPRIKRGNAPSSLNDRSIT